MLALLGDIHGHTGFLRFTVNRIKTNSAVKAIFQVGDFGIYADSIKHFQNNPLDFPVYFIDGNHEDHTLLMKYTEITEIAPNLFYVPRGTVFELDGKVIAAMGGAASVDKELRLRRGMMWHEEENITVEQIERFLGNAKNKKIDIMVVHNPPQWMIQKHFDSKNLLMFGLPKTWKDVNADIIEHLWREIGQPTLYAGHMHESVVDGNCRILDINEVYIIP